MIRFQRYTQDTQAEINLVTKAFYEMCNSPDVVHSGHWNILIVSTRAHVLLYYDV